MGLILRGKEVQISCNCGQEITVQSPTLVNLRITASQEVKIKGVKSAT
jgi:hypothetical protein